MTEPTEPTERLRDARLAQALKHMPDAHLQPGAQARSAVLQEAARAVGAADVEGAHPQRRWWQNLLGQPGSRLPWNTAFASLALAFFVTVLWYEQEPAELAVKEASVAPARETAASAVVATKAPDGLVAERKLSRTPAPATVAAAEALAPPTAAPLAAAPAAPTAVRRPDMAQEQRSRANLSAGAVAGAVSSFTVMISQGAQQHSVSAQEAQPLLAILRALNYGSAAVETVQRAESDGEVLVVEIAGQERWVILGNQARREKLMPGQAGALADAASPIESGAVTPAQYAELRRLALDLAARHK